METPIADIWSLPNIREALTDFCHVLRHLLHAPDRMASASKQNNFTSVSPCFGSCSGLRDGRYRSSAVHDCQSNHDHGALHRRGCRRMVTQYGRNRDCFDAGVCRIEQLALRLKKRVLETLPRFLFWNCRYRVFFLSFRSDLE